MSPARGINRAVLDDPAYQGPALEAARRLEKRLGVAVDDVGPRASKRVTLSPGGVESPCRSQGSELCAGFGSLASLASGDDCRAAAAAALAELSAVAAGSAATVIGHLRDRLSERSEQCAAAASIRALTDPGNADDFARAALLPATAALVDLVGDVGATEAARVHAAAALGNLADSEDRRDDIKDAGAVAPLLRFQVAAAESSSQDASDACSWALGRLAPLTGRHRGAKPI